MTRMEMSESQRLWEAWTDAYRQVVSAPTTARVTCPSHGDGIVRVVFTGDLETRLGYATAWCDSCHEGIALGRAYAPEGVPMVPFGQDPAVRATVIPTDVMLLPPDPWLENAEEEEF